MAFADSETHRGEVLVDVDGEIFRRQAFRNGRKTTHVGKEHRKFLGARSHVELLGIARHLVHQFRRHVLPEQAGDLAHASRLDEEAVSHVEHE
jgi:hypothetical protein